MQSSKIIRNKDEELKKLNAKETNRHEALKEKDNGTLEKGEETSKNETTKI